MKIKRTSWHYKMMVYLPSTDNSVPTNIIPYISFLIPRILFMVFIGWWIIPPFMLFSASKKWEFGKIEFVDKEKNK